MQWSSLTSGGRPVRAPDQRSPARPDEEYYVREAGPAVSRARELRWHTTLRGRVPGHGRGGRHPGLSQAPAPTR